MFFKFISLEFKAFFRSASFQTNLIIKILMGFLGLYIASSLGILSYLIFDLLEEMEPFPTINRYVLYFLIVDLGIKTIFQKLPVVHITPLLSLPIAKSKIVIYTLVKSFQSFFMWLPVFILVPLLIRMLIEGFDVKSSILWTTSIFFFLAINNLLNLLLQNKNSILLAVAVFVGVTIGLDYFTDWNILYYFGQFFELFYANSWFILLAFSALLVIVYFTYKIYLSNLYLDEGVAIKNKHTKIWGWADNLHTEDPFLQNDIRLILRNKRSRGTLFVSLVFIAYGLYFYYSMKVFNNSINPLPIIMFLMATGGFIFTFGQYVPSWDSSYYPLLMTQNIKYRDYLKSKWRILVIGGLITSVICLGYLLLDINLILPILAAVSYNLGINTQLALLTGAYIRTPVDLSKNKNIFGERKAFNIQTMLISLPMFLIPILAYMLMASLVSQTVGYLTVMAIGILGFLFKEFFFNKIEHLYKKHKYITIHAYKQTK